VCYDAARQLFQQGLQIDPLYLHLWQVCVSVLCDGRKGGVVVVFVGERGGPAHRSDTVGQVPATMCMPGWCLIIHAVLVHTIILCVFISCLLLLQAWGVMEYQLGNYSEARRLFQEGVWADPGNKDVVYVFQVCQDVY
jgi:hypothetical protein